MLQLQAEFLRVRIPDHEATVGKCLQFSASIYFKDDYFSHSVYVSGDSGYWDIEKVCVGAWPEFTNNYSLCLNVTEISLALFLFNVILYFCSLGKLYSAIIIEGIFFCALLTSLRLWDCLQFYAMLCNLET